MSNNLERDDLFKFIRDAQDIDLDFSELPFTVTEFYSHLGLPDYLAERAANDSEANAASTVEIDIWTLHSGATYDLTHSAAAFDPNSICSVISRIE